MTVDSMIRGFDIAATLSSYDLGVYLGSSPFRKGAGQTTLLIETSSGRYVFKCYENRSLSYVLFEIDVLTYLKEKSFPVAPFLLDSNERCSNMYLGKPYVLLRYVEGEHCENPGVLFDPEAASQVALLVAELHTTAQHHESRFLESRYELTPSYGREEFQRLHSSEPSCRYARWFQEELDELEFPGDLPRGFCHADLNHGHFLFCDGEVVALLDFDMSCHTYLVCDLASLIYWWAFPPGGEIRFDSASLMIKQYSTVRPLHPLDERYIFDALKLIVLLGIAWSPENEFDEGKRAVDYLNQIGRVGFLERLFGQAD